MSSTSLPSWGAALLKPGTYDATVVSARVSLKDTISWLKIVFEVTDEHGEVRRSSLSLFRCRPSRPLATATQPKVGVA